MVKHKVEVAAAGNATLTIHEAKSESVTIRCPIRGELTFRGVSAHNLTPLEEVRRIELVRFLLDRGYPADHILFEPVVKRLGHKGKNSQRADLAVTDIPASQVRSLPEAKRLKHCLVLAEVKRDNVKAAKLKARETQVEPLLAFGPHGCVAVYWDDVEHRLLWHDENKDVQEADIAYLPRWGASFTGVEPLSYDDLTPVESLKKVFEVVADVLHQAGVSAPKRMPIVLQLLLAKFYDESKHQTRRAEPLGIQDPKRLKITPEAALAQFNTLLKEAVRSYNLYLPDPVPSAIPLKAPVLVEVLSQLSGHLLHAATGQAIQDLYMWFGDELFRRKLGAHFTPTHMTDFIVRAAAPQQGDYVKDPAVGTADFLMAVHRIIGSAPNGMPNLFGADVDEVGVQSAKVNVLLHSATSDAEIVQEDSLASIDGPFSQRVSGDGELQGFYDLVITNPPFGKRILERKPKTLGAFDLGYMWSAGDDGELEPTDQLLDAQETGVLFLEAAVRQARPDGGRIAIVVPNGYLGNRSVRYLAAREWLLRHCRIAAIVSFPRFAFKGSGADVSASVLLLERRETPLARARDGDEYPVAVELVEQLGWQVGVKNEVPAYVRDPSNGAYVLDDRGRKILDQDYDDVLARLASSEAAERFPWLARGATRPTSVDGWSVPIKLVLDDPDLCLDPKRLCAKFWRVRDEITAVPHFALRDVVSVVPEMSAAAVGKLSASDTYRYVEIQDVGPGSYRATELRGWELPTRARHRLKPSDLLVGGIWGSVSKWFIAGHEENLIATNGFHRLRVVDPDLLIDLVVGMCTEAYAVQARGLSRGSDGLAELTDDDLLTVVLPRITDPVARQAVEPFIKALVAGHTSLRTTVAELSRSGGLPTAPVPSRRSHAHLV